QRRAIPNDVQRIVASCAGDVQRVGPGAAVDCIRAVAEQVVEGIVAGLAAERVIAGAAGQRIVAGTATDDVGAAAGTDGVAATLAVDDIDATVDRDAVVALAADEVFDARYRIGPRLGAGRGRGDRADRGTGVGARQIIRVGDAAATVQDIVAVADSGEER